MSVFGQQNRGLLLLLSRTAEDLTLHYLYCICFIEIRNFSDSLRIDNFDPIN